MDLMIDYCLSYILYGVYSLINYKTINPTKRDNWHDALYLAASNGDVDELKNFSSKTININAKNQYDRTALMFAAIHGQTEFLKALLSEFDININDVDVFGKTALMLAAEFGKIVVLQELLLSVLVINDTDKYGSTALMLASKNGHLECVTELLSKHYINVNAKDNCGTTALMFAARGGHIKCLKELLLRSSIYLKALDIYGETAEDIAANSNQKDCAQLIKIEGLAKPLLALCSARRKAPPDKKGCSIQKLPPDHIRLVAKMLYG